MYSFSPLIPFLEIKMTPITIRIPPIPVVRIANISNKNTFPKVVIPNNVCGLIGVPSGFAPTFPNIAPEIEFAKANPIAKNNPKIAVCELASFTPNNFPATNDGVEVNKYDQPVC